MGFTILSGLAALLLLPSAVRSLRPRIYVGALLLFLAYAGVSATWSPREIVLLEFDFVAMKFAVRSEMIRLGLLVLAIGGLMAAASRMSEAGRRRLAVVSQAMFLVQIGVLVLLALFENQALELFSGFMPESGEGVQNISRNSLIMALAVPFLLIGLSEGRARTSAAVIGTVVIALASFVLVFRGVHAGLLAMAAAAVCMLVIRLMPRSGFKLIGVLIAILIMSAPWTFGFLSQGANFATADDSITYRAAIWQRVIELINEDPLRGHGLGVLRTIREPIAAGVFTGEFTIPNHSHNMTLQLWAETGAIGAGFLSLAIMMAGWRMPPADRMGLSAFRAAALVGSVTSIACVSFDLWNEWWWAVVGLLAVLAVASPREARVQAPAARSITFGDNRIGGETAGNSAQSASDDTGAAEIAEARSHEAASIVAPQRAAVPRTNNNFHLVRLLLALMVVAYHAAILPGIALWESVEGPLSIAAELGVQGFFVVSGYLVWSSLQRSASIGLYAEKRVRRLFPAYVVVVAVCAIGALIVSEEARGDLGGVGRYVGWNLAFLNFMEPSLPGLFEGNRFSEVNGALWTLKIEVMFYIILPVLGWMLVAAGQYRWLLIVMIYAGAEAWRIVFEQMGATQGGGFMAELSRQLPGQMSFFITGIALAAWRDHVNWRSAVVPLAVILLVASVVLPSLDFLRAASLGVTIVWIATGLPHLFNAARLGDFSYGIYIVHFPIIQALVAGGLFLASPWLGLAAAFAGAFSAAALLWWLIERPALREDSAYR